MDVENFLLSNKGIKKQTLNLNIKILKFHKMKSSSIKEILEKINRIDK